jgi:prepilin-type processing-associated H-X9-DG protein
MKIFYCPNYFQTFEKTYKMMDLWGVRKLGCIQFVNAFWSGTDNCRMKIEYLDTARFQVRYNTRGTFAKVTSVKSSEAMAQDVCLLPSGSTTFRAGHKEGINVVFADGHTEWFMQRSLDSVNFQATGSFDVGAWSMYPGQM